MTFDRYFQAYADEGATQEQLTAAGWLSWSPVSADYNVEQYINPVHQVIESPETEVSVLLYPGCFAPIHQGHLQAMQLAKKAVEATGETVIAGYYAPDNDAYVMRKTNGDKRFAADKRINLINEACEGSDWLNVDSWPALQAASDLNFTIYYDRLLSYLQHWAPEKTIKLYMVFGQDNALFANAFTEHGYGVCVPREGAAEYLDLLTPGALKRTLFPEIYSTSDSSTRVRETYVERVDPKQGAYVLLTSLQDMPGTNLKAEEVLQVVTETLEKATGCSVTPLSTEDKLQRKVDERTISLNQSIEAPYHLDVSRVFRANTYQKEPVRYSGRVGGDTLDEQLSRIPSGAYVLVDDDIITGGTMRFAAEALKKVGVEVESYEAALSVEDGTFDVVDLKDFIVGHEGGGLTVLAPDGSETRMPYMYPYVNLVSRASVDPGRERKMSSDLWLMNARIYAETGIRVKDIENLQGFRKFGIDENITVEQMCLQHALDALLNPVTG